MCKRREGRLGSSKASSWSFRVSIKVSLFIRDMLNNFHLRHVTVVLESHDWRSPGIRDLEVAWQVPSHSHNNFAVLSTNPNFSRRLSDLLNNVIFVKESDCLLSTSC